MTDMTMMIVGQTSVGKTSFMYRFKHRLFLGDYEDVGILDDCECKVECIDDDISCLRIQDTPNTEHVREWERLYYPRNEGFFFLYSTTSRDSFDDLPRIREAIKQSLRREDFPIVVVATKCDLEDQRKVSIEEGQAFAASLGCPFFEVSSKTSANVIEAFFQLAREIRKDRIKQSMIKTHSSSKQKGCILM